MPASEKEVLRKEHLAELLPRLSLTQKVDLAQALVSQKIELDNQLIEEIV